MKTANPIISSNTRECWLDAHSPAVASLTPGWCGTSHLLHKLFSRHPHDWLRGGRAQAGAPVTAAPHLHTGPARGPAGTQFGRIQSPVLSPVLNQDNSPPSPPTQVDTHSRQGWANPQRHSCSEALSDFRNLCESPNLWYHLYVVNEF